MNVAYNGITEGNGGLFVGISFPQDENFVNNGGTASLALTPGEGSEEAFALAENTITYTSEDTGLNVPVTFNKGEVVGEYSATIVATFGENLTSQASFGVTVTEGTTNNGDDPIDPTPDPEEPVTNESEDETFDFDAAKTNDFFARKDVNDEVIRVFEEDYWPVDMLNVEPEKFAIMPGEGIELDCMFGDTTMDIEAIEAAANSTTTNTGD